MQLLTASKLSTVAMLAMAAVLHFSVSALPMEQAGVEVAPVVEDVPSPKAPVDPYKPLAPGKPSEQAFKDLFDILVLQEPEGSNDKVPQRSDDPSELFGTVPNEMIKQITKHMDPETLASFAQTDYRNFGVSKEQFSDRLKKLKPRMDEAWDEHEKALSSNDRSKSLRQLLFLASPAWEKPLKEGLGLSELKECPFDQLPYISFQRFQPPNPEEEASFFAGMGAPQIAKYARRNICRLAVNGGYFWLLRAFTLDEALVYNNILSILLQLSRFSSSPAFVGQLDKIIPLLISTTKAHGRKPCYHPDDKYALVVSKPSLIPDLKLYSYDIYGTLTLLLAIKQHKSGSDTHLNVGNKNLLKSIELGDMNEFIANIKPFLSVSDTLSAHVEALLKDTVHFDADLGNTRRLAVSHLLNRASNGFREMNSVIWKSDLLRILTFCSNPLEVLSSALDPDQFIRLYDETFGSEKKPVLILLAGRSVNGDLPMKHVFEDIFGKQETPIREDLQIDGQRVDANHLTELAAGCAAACATENWPVFVQLLIKKIQATPQLPGNAEDSAASSETLVEQVAEKVNEIIDLVNWTHANKVYDVPLTDEQQQQVKESVDEVTGRLEELTTALAQSSGRVSPSQGGSKQEPSDGKLDAPVVSERH